jgi:Xaa-Pro aminopeptidase
MIVSVKAQKIAKVLKRIFFHDKKVGYDSLSLELFKELKKRIKVTFIPIEYEILKCRAIKEEAEIAIMERTVQLAGIGMEAVRRSIRPGIAEFELAAEAIYAMKRAGAEAESHMPAIRSGENAEHLQRFDSERRLIPGDAVIVDLGARYRGYSAEYCRTMIVDRPRKELKEIYKVLFEAYQQGIEEIKPGTLTQKIDHTIRRAITKAGYPDYPHATGHGIGMANAEYPPINRTSKVPLEEGMIICVEPGIYLPGVGAVKEEDVILVTHRGHRVLTQTPYDERLVR